jgi:hypothetical protein
MSMTRPVALAIGGTLMAATGVALFLAGLSHAASTAQAAVKSSTVKLEPNPATGVPRVTLAAKSVERLGIRTGQISEELISRKQMVSGLVVPVGDKAPAGRSSGGGFGGYGQAAPASAAKPGSGFALPGQVKTSLQTQAAPAAPVTDRTPVTGEVWVLVTLSPGEYERLSKDRPARLLPLATRDTAWKEMAAAPNGMEPVEDIKRTMMSVYYKVPGKNHGLAINDRLRVELPLSGSEAKQLAVPYGAVYYDAKGSAWVYVNPEPMTYERQRITVDRIVGDTALLSAGPPVGTPVVTVGTALLYGTEIFKK